LTGVWYFLEAKKRKARDKARRKAAKEAIAAENGEELEQSGDEEEPPKRDHQPEVDRSKVAIATSKMSAEAIETAAETVMHEQQLHQALDPSR
jgi:hypothetical protein